MAKCTGLQRRLVEIFHGQRVQNKREAYELAGYKATGETARVEAERTLRLPHVKKYLKSLQKLSQERAVKSAAEIIRELEKVGFSNIKDYIEVKKGKLVIKDFAKMTSEQLAAVAEISERETLHGGTITFKLYDKLKALKDLGLRFGIFPTKVEHTGEVTLAQAVHKVMTDEKDA